jgi:hypothetical protein
MTYYDEMICGLLPPEERSKAIRIKLKLIWYEHVKRRPALIQKWKPLWDKGRESWLANAKLGLLDSRKNTPSGFYPVISQEEQQIIDTPLDVLMEEFEKTLV